MANRVLSFQPARRVLTSATKTTKTTLRPLTTNRLLTDRLLVDLLVLAKDKPLALAWLARVAEGLVADVIAEHLKQGLL